MVASGHEQRIRTAGYADLDSKPRVQEVCRDLGRSDLVNLDAGIYFAHCRAVDPALEALEAGHYLRQSPLKVGSIEQHAVVRWKVALIVFQDFELVVLNFSVGRI